MQGKKAILLHPFEALPSEKNVQSPNYPLQAQCHHSELFTITPLLYQVWTECVTTCKTLSKLELTLEDNKIPINISKENKYAL